MPQLDAVRAMTPPKSPIYMYARGSGINNMHMPVDDPYFQRDQADYKLSPLKVSSPTMARGRTKKTMRNASNISDSPAECSVCGKQFTATKNLRRHMLAHDKNSKKFKCSWCVVPIPRPDVSISFPKALFTAQV